MSGPKDLFVKTPLALLEIPGFPPRLRELYGRLGLHAGRNGACYPTHATLARELGLKSRRQVINLLQALHRFKLIRWTRSDHFNRYEILPPDVKWISHRKDSSSKKRSKKRTPPTPSSRSTEKPGAGTGTKPKAKPKLDDDDEPKPNLSPEAEFRERLAARHGPRFDADACLKSVHREIEKCTGLSLADFLALDETRTTGHRFTNANGYYVHLAKDLVKATIQQARRAIRRTADEPVAEPKPDSKGPCGRCGGVGKLKDGEYCDCQMGRDLATVERRKPKSEPQSARKGAA